MFCVFSFEEETYTGMSIKVDDHRFLEMTDRPQFRPAPYMARAKWVQLIDKLVLRIQN
jgi:predicted DNA-binding protein (MmcQ/YjbR family)